MTTYAQFTEHNEWEGETWVFWLQREGNEDALRLLAERLGELSNAEDDDDDDDDTGEYVLDLDVALDEHDVDVLVRYGATSGGYLPAHTKVQGTLRAETVTQFDLAKLYKGGVKKLFT